MSVLPTGFGSSSSVYSITNSLRLRKSASPYSSRTFSTPTDNKKWSFVTWVKRGALDASAQELFGANAGGHKFGFDSSDRLYFTNSCALTTNRVFRDPTAHMMVMAVFDSANATEASRVKIYVNGGQETSFSSASYPTLNATGTLNSAVAHYIGAYAASEFLDGLLSDVHFIDGQALTPSNFGETNVYGVWVPKSYTGTYGTNGFHLDFADAAVTSGSNAGLGKDVSGNGNYFNTTNISVTAGVTYDALTDTPTNNYATINALDYNNTYLTLSAANLQQTYAGVTAAAASRGTLGIPTTDKWYWEVYITATGGGSGERIRVGICKDEAISGNTIDNSATHYMQMSNGQKRTGTTDSTYGSSFSATQIMQVLYDADAGSLYFGQNNSFANGTGIFNQLWSGAAAAFTGLSGQFFPAQITYGGADIAINFGQRPFTYTPPTGFKALCTANMPAVAIKKPKAHFDVKTYTGNASTQSITGLTFTPGLLELKSRGRAVDWAFYDQVRGVEKRLESNNAEAEVTGDTTGVTAFNSDGWTMGALDQINGTTATNSFVGFAWKANGAGSSNTDGTITSTVSANTVAGFSIVTYTGTGANATVGHGLSASPKLIIVKDRTAASTNDWAVYHAGIASDAQTDYLLLNSTAAAADLSTYWNDTAPTSSVFSIGTDNDVNQSSHAYVAYCFAEIPGYSKFGGYSGSNTSDGAFIYCGFCPKWVMIKRGDGPSQEWNIYDCVRDIYNPSTLEMQANSSAAESSAGPIDFTASGFKFRTSDSGLNGPYSYIFAAFAEHPFGGSNVAPSPAR